VIVPFAAGPAYQDQFRIYWTLSVIAVIAGTQPDVAA